MSVENSDIIAEAQKGKRDHEKIALELAGMIRAENKIANLVGAGHFAGPEQCEKCEAVAIQADAPKVNMIARAYRSTFPNTEIHFFNSEGDFVEGPQIEDTAKFTMPSLKKKKSKLVEPEPVSEEELNAAKAAIMEEANATEIVDTQAETDSDSSTDAGTPTVDSDAAESVQGTKPKKRDGKGRKPH
jgi:hypothetical protein